MDQLIGNPPSRVILPAEAKDFSIVLNCFDLWSLTTVRRTSNRIAHLRPGVPRLRLILFYPKIVASVILWP